MRRLILGLASLAIASACGGGGTPTSPGPTPISSTPPAPTPGATPASSWHGTMTAVRHTQVAQLDTTQTFEGTVTFEPGDIVATYESPDGEFAPLVPAGSATYILKPGLLRLTHTGGIAPCSYGTGTWDVLMKQSDGYLFVTPNRGVSGRVTLPDTTFPVTVTCPTGATAGVTSVQMDLRIAGTVAVTRISGTMTPFTSAGTTFTGSWNLEAR